MKGDVALNRLEQLLHSEDIPAAASLIHLLRTHAPEHPGLRPVLPKYAALRDRLYSPATAGYTDAAYIEQMLPSLEHDWRLLRDALRSTQDITRSDLSIAEKDQQIQDLKSNVDKKRLLGEGEYGTVIEQIDETIIALESTRFEDFSAFYRRRVDRMKPFYQAKNA